MKHLLIIGHIPSPNTRALCDAVERGARNPGITGVDVRVLPPFEATAKDALSADGIILGTTENLGYMSGALKDFFDRCYYDMLEPMQGRPVGVYIRAGLDGVGTSRALASIVENGLGWRLIAPHLILHGGWQEVFLTEAEELGTLMAAGLEAGIF